MRIILFYIFIMMLSSPLSQAQSPYITDESIQEHFKDLDLEKKKEILVPKNIGNLPKSTFQFSDFFSVLGYILVVGLVGFILISLVRGYTPRVKSSAEIDLDNIEDIEKVDLDILLRNALEEKNYRMALRIEFLQILKLLSIKGKIVWKNHKTNRNYLSETRQEKIHPSFQYVVQVFEYFWYGSNELTKDQYDHYRPNLVSFKEQLNAK